MKGDEFPLLFAAQPVSTHIPAAMVGADSFSGNHPPPMEARATSCHEGTANGV